jgi:hypothetical protein
VTSLRLSKRGLNGQIPASIANLKLLDELLLDGNKLYGEIPVELANLKNLVKVDLGYNMLTSNDLKVKRLLIKINSDWYQTQTITPTGINWLSRSTPSINGMWVPISYIEGDGYYYAKCGTIPGGPYPLTAPSLNKSTALISLDDEKGIKLDKNYYCRVQTITFRDGEHNNFDLYSPFSEEFLVSTTPEGLQKQHLSFPAVLDTFVTRDRPQGNSVMIDILILEHLQIIQSLHLIHIAMQGHC